MSILSDKDIKDAINKKNIIIEPFYADFLNSDCYYCHLGNKFYIPKKQNQIIDISDPDLNASDYFDYVEKEEIILDPGEFILGETYEKLGSNTENMIRLYNTTSLARWGIFHAGLGFVNAGCGFQDPIKLTVELCNMFPYPIRLRSTIEQGDTIIFGTEILKICIVPLSSKADNSYLGKYGKDKMVTLSKAKETVIKKVR